MICRQRVPKQEIVIRDYFSIRPDMKLILIILSVGIPSGIENGMFQFGKLAIQSTVSTLNDSNRGTGYDDHSGKFEWYCGDGVESV